MKHYNIPLISLAVILYISLSFVFVDGIEAKAKNIQTSQASRNNQLLIKLNNKSEVHKVNFVDDSDMGAITASYKRRSEIGYVEPNYIYRASLSVQDPFYYKQWYINQINADAVWGKASGAGVVVAVLDSGIDIDNPDMTNNIWTNTKESPNDGIDNDQNGYIDDVHGWDFADNTNDPKPKFEPGYTATGINHGTIIAGVISAEGNNGQGVIGIAWKSKIMPLRVLDGQGSGDVLSVAKAIDYAVANGASIINMSFVGSNYSQTVFDSIKKAYDSGVILLAAAGNKTQDVTIDLDETLLYPICYDSGESVNRIIGVTGLDTLDQKSSAFNFGAKCVDISAPGVGFYGLQVYNPQYGQLEYQGGLWSGTSIATAVVSGAAAVLKSHRPDLTNKEIAELLIRTTDNIDGMNPTMLKKLGSGRVNLLNAVNVASSIPGKQQQAVSEPKINTVKITTGVPGAKNRIATMKEFNRIYGYLPQTAVDWDDFNNLSVGVLPIRRSASAENKAIKDFSKIFKRLPKEKQEWFFVKITAYGLRPVKRDLALESQALQAFRKIYKRLPKSDYDWNIMRAIAYR